MRVASCPTGRGTRPIVGGATFRTGFRSAGKGEGGRPRDARPRYAARDLVFRLVVIAVDAFAPLRVGHVRPVLLVEAGGVLQLLLVHVEDRVLPVGSHRERRGR